MRLFLAIDVNDEVQRRATDVRRHVDGRHPAAARGLRWVRADQLHLTVRFLGEVSEALAGQIVAACHGILEAGTFSVEFGSASWLPPGGTPRVLMLPVVSGLEPLRHLKALVDRRLPAGIPPDDPRPFTPHLTLARVREALRREVRILAREMTATRWPAVASPVNHVSLMRSVLSPRGPDYDELARLVLGSTG